MAKLKGGAAGGTAGAAGKRCAGLRAGESQPGERCAVAAENFPCDALTLPRLLL